jgi:hypothetical protein
MNGLRLHLSNKLINKTNQEACVYSTLIKKHVLIPLHTTVSTGLNKLMLFENDAMSTYEEYELGCAASSFSNTNTHLQRTCSSMLTHWGAE